MAPHGKRKLADNASNLPQKKRHKKSTDNSDADYLTCRVPEHLWGALEPLYKGLPPEIFDVIISHLEPLDLLHLRCTDKAFRALVHGNPALWRQARENLRANNSTLPVLPPVPKGMSEASFMNIMFRNWMTCNCKELARRRGRLHAPCCRTCLYNRHRSEWSIHYIDLKIKDKEYSFRKQCAAFLDAWIIARERRKVAQAASDKALIQRRFMDIIKRLNAQGCRKDVEWRDTKSVIRASRYYSCRPERITPFIWKNKLEPKFMALIDDVRVRRRPEVIAERREEFLRLYKQALTSLPPRMPHLNAIDIAHCPPFTSLMKLIDETHINQEIHWIPARDFEQTVATAHKNLLGSMDTQLLTLIKDHGLPPTREELTVTRFKCDKCATIVAYPAVLVHSCRRGRDCNAEDQLVLDSKYCWRSDVFIPLEASATRRMLRSLPVTQMQDQPLYVCRLCHDEATTFNSNTLPLMTWREAAKHDNHDDWMFVREPASIIFGQIRMEVEVGPQWRRRNVACVTIHGVQYEIQGDEIVHLSEMAE